MAASYPDEVWKAIQDLWSVSEKKVSWRIILEQVADALNCDVPSIKSASQKCERERWEKSVKKVVKKGVKDTVKKLKDLPPSDLSKILDESRTKGEDFTDENSSENTGKNDENLQGSTGVACIDKYVVGKQTYIEQLIARFRNHSVNLFMINGKFSSALSDFYDEFMETDFSKATDAERQAFSTKLSILERVSYISNVHTRSSEVNLKMLIGLHGLESDDFKDREAAKAIRTEKMAVIDAKLKEQEGAIMDQKREMLMRDISLIESGMDEDYLESEQQAIQAQADEDEALVLHEQGLQERFENREGNDE